ncbi:hypothetical protein JVU11DRAFT_7254 [Chiua virens]|nr:hypothetical protein JVU11DRAFT_7254 [Chiua virens]
MADRSLFYVRAFGTAVEIIGLLLTAWRIYLRLRIGRFWWEDAWASLLLVTGMIWVITYWLGDTSYLSSIVGGWIGSIGFTCIVTFARMSVLFSVIRIIHGPPRLLKFTYACVAFFAACWTVIIVAKITRCAFDPSWHYTHKPGLKSTCLTTAQITIFQFTTDCVAVSILVVIPLNILWKVKLPRRKKRMILSIFASSVVLAFGALFHTVGLILRSPTLMTAGMHVVIALSMIVCNLLVVVTCTYRFLLRDVDMTEDSSNDDDFTTRARPSAAETASSLTTVDLDVSLTGPGTGIRTENVSVHT